jgi:hypothetical protein
MKLHGKLTINGKEYNKGDNIPWHFIYPFFMVHMLLFGGSGFAMAYFADSPDPLFLFIHGGIAILVYLVFYCVIFGLDEVKWMIVNALLGLIGIYAQIGWLLSVFGKKIDQYPYYIHIVPMSYFVLYTFLLRQATLDAFGVRADAEKSDRLSWILVVVWLILDLVLLRWQGKL